MLREERGGPNGALARGATCMDFSIGPHSLLERLRPRDTEAGLVYPDVFCGDILSYKIADIHRISIEMAADVVAAIGRCALSRRSSRSPRSRSALSFVRLDRAQFYSNFSPLRRSHYYNAGTTRVSAMRQNQHSISPINIYIHPRRRIGSSPTFDVTMQIEYVSVKWNERQKNGFYNNFVRNDIFSDWGI